MVHIQSKIKSKKKYRPIFAIEVALVGRKKLYPFSQSLIFHQSSDVQCEERLGMGECALVAMANYQSVHHRFIFRCHQLSISRGGYLNTREMMPKQLRPNLSPVFWHPSLNKEKTVLFGTIDPNVGGWGRVNPNFYKSLFLWHI